MTKPVAKVSTQSVEIILNKLQIIQDLTDQLYLTVKTDPNVLPWQKSHLLSLMETGNEFESLLKETLTWEGTD